MRSRSATGSPLRFRSPQIPHMKLQFTGESPGSQALIEPERAKSCATTSTGDGGLRLFAVFGALRRGPGLEDLQGGAVIDAVALHPADRPQVLQPLHQPPPRSVLGLAAQTRMVADRDLRHAPTAHLEQSGQETVQAVVKLQTLETLMAIGFQRTSRVDDVVAGRPIAEAIGDARTQALPGAVLTTHADAADGVPLAEHRDQAGNLAGIVLQVAVNCHNGAAAGQPESRRHRRCLAEVVPEVRDADARIPLLSALEQLERPVGAAVIDEEDLDGCRPVRQRRTQALDERRDVLRFVVHRNDHRQRVAAAIHLLRPRSCLVMNAFYHAHQGRASSHRARLGPFSYAGLWCLVSLNSFWGSPWAHRLTTLRAHTSRGQRLESKVYQAPAGRLPGGHHAPG